MEMAEKLIILECLKYNHGNKARTALMLDVAVRTLDNKLEKYEIEAKQAADWLKKKQEEDRKALEEARYGKSGDAKRGLHLEPLAKISPERSVSVRFEDKVQEMPSQQTESSGANAGKAKRAAAGGSR